MNNEDSPKFKTFPNSFKKSEPFCANGDDQISEARSKIIELQKENKLLNERENDILESISEALFTLNKDWQFTYANRATGELLARAPATLPGKSIWVEYPGFVGSDFEP